MAKGTPTPIDPADPAAVGPNNPELWAAVQAFEDSLETRDKLAAQKIAIAADLEALTANLAKATTAEAEADQALRDALTALGNVAAALVVPPAPVPPA